MVSVRSVMLNRSVSIPQLGFGVWQMDNIDVVRLVKFALDAGYRSIDTAALYGNEEGVGQAIAESVPRDEIFVTSKLENESHGTDEARRAFDETTRRLGLDVVDLYLIHWPMPKLDRYIETWKALETLRSRAGSGPSAFPTSRSPISNGCSAKPGQPLPSIRSNSIRHFSRRNSLSSTGGTGSRRRPGVPSRRVRSMNPLSRSRHKTSEKLCSGDPALAHAKGNIAIPKSAAPSRIVENITIFDFELDSSDMLAIDASTAATGWDRIPICAELGARGR